MGVSVMRLLDAGEGAQMIPNAWDHWGLVKCVCVCVIRGVSARI